MANVPNRAITGQRGGGPMKGRLNAEKPKDLWNTIKRLLSYLGRSRYILYGLIGLMVIVTYIEILGPLFQQKAIDTISVHNGSLSVDLAKLRYYLALMLAMHVITSILSYYQSILGTKLSQKTVYNLRNDLFAKISRLSIAYTDSHAHGDIMSRMTNDAETVSNSISSSITTLLSAIMTLVGALVMMLRYSWIMTIVSMVTIPLTVMLSNVLAKKMQTYHRQQQVLLGSLNGQVEEMVTGYHTVVAYGKEGQAIEDFSKIADDLKEASIKARVWGSIMGPLMNIISNLQYVLLAATGGFLMLRGANMTVGSIQAMLQYSKKFSRPINQIANQYSSLLTALAAAERIFEIMDQPDEIDEGKVEMNPYTIKGDIEYQHVQFGYVPEKLVLTDLNLSIRAGQRVAIVGATGSGKTTIINLLIRYYELNGGKVFIDGVDITTIPKETLRDMIAIVLQDTVLFHDTIENNISYGKDDTTLEEVKRAAQIAMADQFIDRLPDGYQTVLAEGGSNLSQGQRQLITIARAVLADSKILILDEATSSVDTRTEMQIQQAMVNLMKDRTSIIIAHRLSTIRDADMIVVLKDGVICEAGSHDELLALKGEYHNLYAQQFAGVRT